MKADPATALQLLDKILTNEIDILSKDDADFLQTHKEICVRKLLPILALEVTQIKEDEDWDSHKLYGSLKLLAAFEEKKAFDWVVQLHEFPEALQEEDGCFILLFWADILVATISNDWSKLKLTIENPEIHEEIREACLDALLILVAKDKLERSSIVKYFQNFYDQALAGELYDPELLPLLLEASLALWPGESIEEIRELFGLNLVNDDFISLPEILTAFEEGPEECLSHLREWTTFSHLLEFFIEGSPSSEQDSFEEDFEEAAFEEEFDEIELDEDCSDFDSIKTDSFYLLPCLEINKLPQKEQKKYNSLPKLLLENPEKAIEVISEMIANYPDIPSIFYYYHMALMTLDAKVLAMEVVKEWVNRFPNDLLGKIEYANYFLRRCEPEQVKDLFSNTWSLTALYPERTAFHEIECLKFFHLTGLYLLQIDDVEKAQELLQILDTTNPNSFEYYDLKRKIELHLQEDLYLEDL